MNAKSKSKNIPPTKESKKRQEDTEEKEFNCFLCGICCTKYHVHVTLPEAHRIAAELGLIWGEWLDKYIEPRWPGYDSCLLRRKENGSCLFLEEVAGSKLYRCQIHPFRPSSCREWSPGLHRTECQQGLTQFWQLTVNNEGKIKGTKEKLADFHSFLNSLCPTENLRSKRLV